MKRGIVAAVVVVIIAIAAWLVFANGNSSNNSSLYGNNNNNSTSNQTPASNDNTSASGANNSQTASTNKVTIANMAFTPSQVTINKGDSVTWTNNDNTTHTVTDDLSNAGGPSSGDIAPGGTYSFTFTKSGSFQYHCSIHPSMRGTIVVK